MHLDSWDRFRAPLHTTRKTCRSCPCLHTVPPCQTRPEGPAASAWKGCCTLRELCPCCSECERPPLRSCTFQLAEDSHQDPQPCSHTVPLPAHAPNESRPAP